jgi:hypothetical protein
VPDVLVELTLEDYLALRDPVLEAILAWRIESKQFRSGDKN